MLTLPRTALRASFLSVALAALASPSLAQPESEIGARGFHADKVYNLSGVDSINLFNGNLTLAIPLGIEYPVSEKLSYQLHLSYNSAAWEYEDVDINGELYPLGIPLERSNAGLGWMVTLGKLEAPDGGNGALYGWNYISPDGGSHAFHPLLHDDDFGGVDDPGVWYTRDSTYLRLQQVGNEMIVEHGNGIVRVFNDFGPSGEPDWRLVKIHDLFVDGAGEPVNWVTIDYPPGLAEWVIDDSHGRQHKVVLEAGTVDLPTQKVQRIELTRFGGGNPALYVFNYDDNDQRYIDRGCRDRASDIDPQQYAPLVNVPLLQRIDMPEGETYEIPIDAGTTVAAITDDCQTDNATGTPERLVLPTGGEIAWDYQLYYFAEACEGFGPPLSVAPSGVATRTFHNLDGSSESWIYDQALTPEETWICDGPNGDEVPEVSETVVIQPDGSCTTSYFYARGGSQFYGLPVVSPEFDADGNFGRYELSSETYQTWADQGTPAQPWYHRYRCSGEPLRSEWLIYSDDYNTGGDRGRTGANRRLEGRATLFHDDQNGEGPYDSEWTVWLEGAGDDTNYDGLGNYRWSRKRSRDELASETVHLEINPSVGQYNPAGSNNNYAMIPATEPWLINNVLERHVQAGEFTAGGTQQAKVRYCYSPEGVVERERRYRRTNNQGDDNDLLSIFEYEDGLRVRHSYYGGDQELLTIGSSASETCEDDPTNTPQYEMVHENEHGVRRRSYWLDDLGQPLTWNAYEVDIDSSTGLPSASYDVSGFRTDYNYDALGRLLTATPEEGAKTRYKYDSFSSGPLATVPAKVSVSLLPAAFGGQYDYREYHYDGFGRLAVEKRKQPDQSLAVRETDYNARGWRVRQSEWGIGGPSPHDTEFENFDPFGRASRIVAPDGSVTTVDWTGIRLMERTEQVAMAGGEGDAITIEEYYVSGRLRKVTQNSGDLGQAWTTRYSYDEAGRLAQVLWEGGNQTREWDYDGRGFLKERIAPEYHVTSVFPWDNERAVYFQDYDALGLPRVVEGARNPTNWVEGRWQEYDSAGRLVSVSALAGTETNPQQGGLLKEFRYATSNGLNNLKLGKLEESVRYNSDSSSTRVEQSYIYSGLGGRVSRRVTTIAGQPRFRLQQTWTEFGALDTLTYPSCIGCGGTGAPTRTLTFDYSVGRLTGIDGGWLDNVVYQPNGLVSEVHHGGSLLVDRWTADPHDMARPARIVTQWGGGPTYFDTGTYSYDGAGNIKQMGSDVFVYDEVQRLVSATLQQGTTQQSFSYDAYGRLWTITTDGNSVNVDWMLSADHDRAGNLEKVGPCNPPSQPICTRFEFDRMEKLSRSWDDWPGADRSFTYIYDANDERVMRVDNSIGVPGAEPLDRWEARDLGGRLLRTFTYDQDTQVVDWDRDFIYRGSALLAKDQAVGGRIHVHLDHLGTTRLETVDGEVLASYAYYPYGDPILTRPDDGDPAYTGHQKDDRAAGGLANLGDLDYMHARHYMPAWGRFLQLDPVETGIPELPQSWARWAYVRGNPLRFVDPDGMVVHVADDAQRLVHEGKLSARFEAIFDELDRYPSSQVDLELKVSSEDAIPGTRAHTTFTPTYNSQGKLVAIKGTIYIPVATSDKSVQAGHEMSHNLEIIKHGKHPKDLPGAREVFPGHYETDQAIQDTATIRSELENATASDMKAARQAAKQARKAAKKARKAAKKKPPYPE